MLTVARWSKKEEKKRRRTKERGTKEKRRKEEERGRTESERQKEKSKKQNANHSFHIKRKPEVVGRLFGKVKNSDFFFSCTKIISHIKIKKQR